MKEQLIRQASRMRLERMSKIAGLPFVGKRVFLEKNLKSLPYSKLKQLITETSGNEQ
jgi:hypothetical protein